MRVNLTVKESDLSAVVDEQMQSLRADLEQGVASLANIAFETIKQTAQDKLGNKYDKYEENLSIEKNGDIWTITLQEEALYLEEGAQAKFMDWLLKNAKQGKNGRYQVIPFKHSTDPNTARPGVNREYSQQIKQHIADLVSDMKNTHRNGQPIIGKISSKSLKSRRPTDMARNPGLQNLNIYQHRKKDGSLGYKAVTFRVISDKHRNEGRWFAPAIKGAKAFEEAIDKSKKVWEDEILPAILRNYE